MKNKKVLVVFLLIILFTVLCSSSCFADTFSYNTIVLDVAKQVAGEKAFCIYYDNDGNIMLAVSANVHYKQIVYNVERGGIYFKVSPSSSNLCRSDVYRYDGSTFNHISNYDICENSGNTGYNGKLFLYSTIDIYNDLESDKIFFLKTPQVIVARQVEEVEMSQVQAEILGILPLILALVVSFLGLRKALKMLATFLRRS